MKYLLNIIIVFSTLLSIGQQRWESLISNGNEYYRATSFTTSDGGLIICAGYNYMCNICKIDVNGQILWSKLFAKDGGIYSYRIKQNNNGLISLTGYSNNLANYLQEWYYTYFVTLQIFLAIENLIAIANNYFFSDI